MLTYQVRKRVFRIDDPSSISFPNSVNATFIFQPLQPFGMSPSGGRTAVHSVSANVKCNLNTGKFYIESSNPLKKLEVMINHKNLTAKLEGNVFTISTYVQSIDELNTLVSGFFYGFPGLLNVELADPPYIEQVYGTIGGIEFRWELEKTQFPFEITDQDRQEKKFANSWLRIPLINENRNRRLMGALAYFHTACRLSRSGCSPWEFMPEIILNLSKVLETLFPPSQDGKTMDSTRKALLSLGYSEQIIEKDFVPVLVLRNNIDVGHAFLSILKREYLNTLYLYTESAEENFRKLLRKIIELLSSGDFKLRDYDDLSPSKDVIKLLKRINERCVPQ